MLIGLSSLFIMPVFFALSGFFYRQVSNLKMFATNIYKKLISFGIPYLFFSVVYAVLQQFFGNVEQGFQALPRIFWMPIGYLWFLLVLFWIYVLVGIVDLLRVDYRLSLGFYFVLFVVSQLIGMPYIFAAVFTWTFTFYLGYAIRINWTKLNRKSVFVLMLIIMVIGLLGAYVLGDNDWYKMNTLSLTNFVAKVASVFVFLYFASHLKESKTFDYFSKMGTSSLVIYLVHAPFTSIFRVIFLKLGLTNYYILIVAVLVASWLISIFAVWLTTKSKFVRWIFFPKFKVSQFKSIKK